MFSEVKSHALLLAAILMSSLTWTMEGVAKARSSSEGLLRLPEIQCADAEPECFAATRAMLATVTERVDDHFIFNSRKTMASQRAERSQLAVVIFPGLYSDSSDFRVLAAKLDEKGYFVMHVSLPGHWGQESRGREVRAEDWIEESRRAIKIAHVMAEKVIVLGHSMGGMLSINAALTPDFHVDGLIAMEPAVSVRPEIAWPLCNFKYFGDSIGDFPKIKKWVTGSEVTIEDQQRSVSMGCEVTKLRTRVLENQFSTFVPTGPGRSSEVAGKIASTVADTVAAVVPPAQAVLNLSQSYSLGTRLRIPSLFLVNTTDRTVSVEHEFALISGIAMDVPHKVAQFSGIEHGLLTTHKYDLVADQTFQFLESFR